MEHANSRLQPDLITALDPLSKVSEAYKMARTNIEFSSIDQPAKVISVTSTHQGEGKTVTLANLAVAYAQAGRRVLILDADLRRPSVHRIFGLSNRRGLTNALISQAGYEAFLQKSGIDGLSILASGPIPPNPAEVVLSERLHQLVQTARQEFDIVLVDSPPIGVVTDSAIIANRADGVVLVIRSGEVDRRDLKRAVEQLRQVKARVLGYIMNGISEKHQDYYYYYEYYQHEMADARKGRGGRPKKPRRGKRNNTVSPVTPSGPDIPIRPIETGPGPVRRTELTLDEHGHLRMPDYSDDSVDDRTVRSVKTSPFDTGSIE